MFAHPVIKVPGLFLVAVSAHVAATPPNPSSDADTTIDPIAVDTFLRKLFKMRSLGYIKASVWSLAFVESAVVLAKTFPSHPTSQIVIGNLIFGGGDIARVGFTPATALGISLGIGCGVVRYWCFRELGKQFTFGMTIQKNHKLVTTGPYRIVRHPSYTGMLMFTTSVTLLTATKGSWVMESGLLNYLSGRILVGTFALMTGLVNVVVLLRMRDEERELRKRFGEKWDRWAAKVRYLLIPGIL